MVEFFQERVVCLSSDEMIDHIDGSGKEDLNIGITSGIGYGFSQEGLSSARVSDQDHILMLSEKIQVKEVEDLSFLIFP